MSSTRHPARIVFAPDSFKGSIRAAAAADALARGWARIRPADDLVRVPMADGGEGTADAFAASVPGARRMPVTVDGPTGLPVDADWVMVPDVGAGSTGVVELAGTSGIELLGPDQLRPLDADTAGFGQAIADAIDHGVARLILAIGSSASSDGGAGVLRALGAILVDERRAPIARGARGLADVASVGLAEMRPLPPGGAVVLTDVSSPLLGPAGAAAVFGPQKGADPDDVIAMESGLARWSALLDADPATPGSGAAGGTGFGLLAWGATFAPGAPTVAELVGLDAALEGAAFAVTGEGSFDGQSAQGKVPSVVLAAAGAAGARAAVVAGRVTVEPEGVQTVSLTELAGSGAAAMDEPARWLEDAGRRLASTFRM